MKYCRHFVQLKTKVNTFVLHNLKLFFQFLYEVWVLCKICVIKNVTVLWHYTIIVVTQELKTNFSYIKTLIFGVFLMVFNAIDSPDIVSSIKQPRYVTLEYCFILIPLYIILSSPVFFNLSFEPESIHFVFSSHR